MRATDPEVLVAEGSEALAERGTEIVVERAGAAIAERGLFSWVLSGGTTPRGLYRRLAGPPYVTGIDWSKVEIFFGDERWVPLDHPDSNYRAAREALLGRVPVPLHQVHPIPVGGPDREETAARYERTIREALGLGAGEVPRFDLVLLGLGEDGHTASLFPGALPEGRQGKLVAAVKVPAPIPQRITLTPEALSAARMVLFLVSGGSKADALGRVLGGDPGDPLSPARLIRPEAGRTLWIVDREAAALLPERSRAPAGRGEGAGSGEAR